MAYQVTQSSKSYPPKAGEPITLSLTAKPPIPTGCSIAIIINGQEVRLSDSVGGLKLTAFGKNASGGCDASFEAETNDPQTTVTFRIKCPDHDPLLVEHKVGLAWQKKIEAEWPDPRSQPPQNDEK